MCIVAGNVHRANIQGEMMDEIILEQVTTEELLRLLQKRVKDVEENTYGQWYTWRDSWLQGKLILHLYEHVGLLQTEEERSRGATATLFKEFVGMVEKYAPNVIGIEEVWRAYVALQESLEGYNGCDE